MMNARREGFTLVELLMVTLIGTIVLGAVYQTMSTQERTNRQQLAIVATEQNARMAMSILTNDLREISAVGGDVIAADSLSIRFRTLRKAGVVCTKDFGGNNWINVAILGDTFAVNDSVLVFSDGASKTSGNDDQWVAAQVSAVASAAGACATNPIGNIKRVFLPSATLAQVDTGALVRSFINIGYRIVNTTTNGVAGATLYRMEGTDSVPIVEGLATVAGEGLRLRYFDINNNAVAYPLSAARRLTIMRMSVKVRAKAIGGQSGANREYQDSLVGQVFLRGNQKTQ